MTDGLRNFSDVKEVVADDLRFRLKLGIGEEAYRTIRTARTLQQLWDLGGVAATGAGVAASNTVASTFFAGSNLLALIGFGTATPIGWIIAAGLGSAGAYWGVMRLARRYGDSRVKKIPEFINTPIDFLGATLVDMMGTLAVKVAAVDGKIDDRERALIIDHLVEEWGIAADYAETAIRLIAQNEGRISLQETTWVLGAYLRQNPDCNSTAMRKELVEHLRDLVAADGRVDEREEKAINQIEAMLQTETSSSIRRTAKAVGRSISNSAVAAARGLQAAKPRLPGKMRWGIFRRPGD